MVTKKIEGYGTAGDSLGVSGWGWCGFDMLKVAQD